MLIFSSSACLYGRVRGLLPCFIQGLSRFTQYYSLLLYGDLSHQQLYFLSFALQLCFLQLKFHLFLLESHTLNAQSEPSSVFSRPAAVVQADTGFVHSHVMGLLIVGLLLTRVLLVVYEVQRFVSIHCIGVGGGRRVLGGVVHPERYLHLLIALTGLLAISLQLL